MTERTPIFSTRDLALCALFTALIAIFSQIAIPLPMGVPVNMALLAVYLCALLIPFKFSMLSIAAFLLLGLIGVPVFAGFRGGPAALFGKTGGYLMGYLLTGTAIGLTRKWLASFWTRCSAMLLGLLLCYVFGTLWFMNLTNLGLMESLGYCVIPFLPGDAAKILLAAMLAPRLATAIKRM